MDLDMRPIAEAEREAFNRAVATAFGTTPTTEELTAWGDSLAVERTLAVFDRGRIVATAGAYSFELTVPGGAHVPTAGVTVVGVHPHRRQGLLTHDGRTARRRGTAGAAAAASGRRSMALRVRARLVQRVVATRRRRRARVAVGRRTPRLVDYDEARGRGPIYDAVARERVGEVTRRRVVEAHLPTATVGVTDGERALLHRGARERRGRARRFRSL
jgi:hypothetical protein